MKKGGLLHPELMYAITALGHYDTFVICDMAFPIPHDAVRIDLAMVEGFPSFMQVVKIMLREVVIDKAILADSIKTINTKLDNDLHDLLIKQDFEYIDFNDFIKETEKAKFFVRTGSSEPYSNMICVSAAGVPAMADARRLDEKTLEF